jgi:hypothetical protein
MGTVKPETTTNSGTNRYTAVKGVYPNGTTATIEQVNAPERDPYNTAVAAELSHLVEVQQTGIVRLVRLTGIPRATLGRYLAGDRDIKVAELRKIAEALNVGIDVILSEADRRLEQR